MHSTHTPPPPPPVTILGQFVTKLLDHGCLSMISVAPRAKAIQKQGFSDQVTARIEAPQRRSTRSILYLKWSISIKWYELSQMDFSLPSIKQISDFLLHLLQDKNLQPSTIDGYRTATN